MERRSLATVTGLVLLGTAVRLGLGPTPADTGWRPPEAADGGIESISTSRLLGAVDSAIAAEERASQPLADGEKIDPNFADEVDLRRLPGIGPSRASAIVRDRREHGPFRSLEELERIPGIGPTTAARLAPMLTLSRRPAPAASSERLESSFGLINQGRKAVRGAGHTSCSRETARRHPIRDALRPAANRIAARRGVQRAPPEDMDTYGICSSRKGSDR
ncbi:MAG: helix-hairpin-helix domain-containing protein [Gemmatimonadota bacterium]